MSRTPGYVKKLPPDLANDPFWIEYHKPPTTSFGGASRRLSAKDLITDHEHHLQNEIEQWESCDKHLTHHGRLQVESRWGRTSTAAPGDYDPNADLRSKMPTFSSTVFTRKEPDHYFEDLQLARTQPFISYRAATARQNSDARKQRGSPHKSQKTLSSTGNRKMLLSDTGTLTNSSSSNNISSSSTHNMASSAITGPKKSEWDDVNVEDMKKALLPAPGQYSTQVYHKLNFERNPVTHLRPRENIGKPRLKIDEATLDIVVSENQLFDGSYFQFHDPTKRSYPSYTLGAKRPIVEREYCRTGPGDYNDPLAATGAPSLLSSAGNLKMKPLMSSSSMQMGLSGHNFGRKTLLK